MILFASMKRLLTNNKGDAIAQAEFTAERFVSVHITEHVFVNNPINRLFSLYVRRDNLV